MDQAAPNMPEKTQKPENNKNYKYSPKHKFIFGLVFPPRIVCSNPTERLKAKSGAELNDRITCPVHCRKNFPCTAKPGIGREQPWMRNVPFWIDSAPIKRFPRLERNVNVDVLVVGAGITAAYFLKKSGLTVALIERERVASIGDGMIVHSRGKKVAAFRDRDGNLLKLSPVCPHLGCYVRWNSAESTWDCPRHGSRLKPTGEVIAGPAEDGLSPA